MNLKCAPWNYDSPQINTLDRITVVQCHQAIAIIFHHYFKKKNGNGKYLLLFLLWVFWMKTTVTRPSLLKSSTVEKYASSDSKWVADSRGDSPKRKIKKFKILHERNYIESNYEWGMPKVMANLKNGIFSNYIQEIKKKNMKNLYFAHQNFEIFKNL